MIILSEKQIQSIYKMEDALRDVEEMLIAKQKNYVQAPVRTVLQFPDDNATSSIRSNCGKKY